MNHAYARITSGIAFEACQTYWTKKQAADEAVNALALEVGCVPGRTLSRGSWLEGLYYVGTGAAVPPKDWRAAGKKFPRYVKPNTKTVGGRALQARLEAIKLPVPEDLAHLLGFPPFFTELGSGSYCSAASCFMRGGVYYVTFPAVLSYRLKDTPGVEFIKEWEYLKAEDEK